MAATKRAASLDEQLRLAIANKRLLQLSYSGRLRVVEPHDYGLHKGSERLLVYQQREAGSASRQGTGGWRLLEVSKIESCVVMEDTFHGSRGASHQHHYTWDVLYARVA